MFLDIVVLTVKGSGWLVRGSSKTKSIAKKKE